MKDRRLAAILVSDAVGYTRLMERDEANTWLQIKSLRTNLFEPSIDEHRGRLIKTMGDGVLAEFPSVAAAIACARQVQIAMAGGVAGGSSEAGILLRIGIDVGDVIVDEDDVYGETVNVAARLQAVSPAGGFCLTRRAYDNLGDRQLLAVEDIGECTVRNLNRPVSALVWRPTLDQQRHASSVLPWQSAIVEQDRDATATRRQQPGPLPPERSSVAVLPFETIREVSEEHYFADGLVDDVIGQLSRFHSLFVIARTSSLAYRGTNRAGREIGKELGVEYVVEGSVRRAGDRVRVAARLVDVADGRQFWAEKYDRTLDDVFAVQDEITEAVVATIAGQVEADRLSKARRKPTQSLQAYDLVLRGLALHRSGVGSYQQMADAAELFGQATGLDPNYARAYAWRACSGARLWPKKSTPAEIDRHIDEAITLCRRALELDPDDAEAHRIMGALFLLRRDYEQAEKHVRRALALNPNHALIAIKAANFYCYAGQPEKAEPLIRRAMRLNPFHPDWYWFELGLCHFVDGQYDEAVYDFQKAEQEVTEVREAYHAASCSILRRDEAAAVCRRDLLAVNPEFTIAGFLSTQPFRDPAHTHRLKEGLAGAGFRA
jgi:adenylate cyclase